jgi:AcrR family transcriptional regulator
MQSGDVTPELTGLAPRLAPGPTPVLTSGPTSGAGSLQQALRVAASQVIIEKGLGAFSIREVARRAGVSHAAPGYHFGDMKGLLTSLATEGFNTLHDALQCAVVTETTSHRRLLAIGRAYVHVALTYPGHIAVMFREDVIDTRDPAYETAGFNAFAILEETVQAIADEHNPHLNVVDASHLCWAAMQGLVTLHPKFQRMDEFAGRTQASVEETVERFTDLLIVGLTGSS